MASYTASSNEWSPFGTVVLGGRQAERRNRCGFPSSGTWKVTSNKSPRPTKTPRGLALRYDAPDTSELCSMNSVGRRAGGSVPSDDGTGGASLNESTSGGNADEKRATKVLAMAASRA